MNKVLTIVFLTLLSFKGTFAQGIIKIEAFVLEKSTNKPLPYVNIGFLGKSIGTVSDETGKFYLEYDEDYIGEFEVLQFSSLGYETLQIKALELFSKLSKTNKIYLEPQNLALDEVLITSVQRENKETGSLDYDGFTLGYWKDKIALGGEIATKIKITKKNSKLLDLKLRILENLSDSLKLRVNVYDLKKKLPGKNLLATNIFHVIKRDKGIDTINLRPYNIKVDDDIIVSIELVEVFGNQVGFAIAGTNNGSTFTRYISQDKWKPIKDAKMAFGVLMSYPKKEDEVEKRTPPKEISILWDTSASMFFNRDFADEMEFLREYLKVLKNVSIKATKFNTQTDESKNFEISNGNSDAIINYLKNTDYEGGTDFSKVFLYDDIKSDLVMLFSDGISTLSEVGEPLSCPIFCIGSSVNSNHNVLQNMSSSENGYYINLTKSNIEAAIKALKFNIEDRQVYNLSETNDAQNNVYGKIYSQTNPLEGVSVRVKGTYTEVFTNEEGIYSIPAKYGDKIVLNYFGAKQKEIQASNNKNIDIELEFEGELLDKISIIGVKRDNVSRDNMVRREDRKYGYSTSYLTEEDINQADVYFVDVLRKMPGVNVSGPPQNPTIWIRDRKKTPAVFVDGIQTLNFLSISPQNISSITILRSLAATNRFGSEGAGGAIMVTTKTALQYKEGKAKNWALKTGNDYEEGKLYPETNTKTSKYIDDLYGAASYDESFAIYKNQKASLKQPSIDFYLDASEYFERWDEETAYKILTNISDLAFNNVKALRTLAYKLEALNKYEEAKCIYKRILKLDPKRTQAYRDLALVYQNTGEHNKAMLLYKQMLLGTIEDLDFSGIRSVLINELRHLVLLHKSEVDYADLPSDLLSINFKKDMRFVFEWNDPFAEFEIQFVNPDKKYFTWELSAFAKNERLMDGLKNGYQIEEFFIDDAKQGKWIINIKNLKKETTLNPTYLKYTVYENFAQPNESKTVRVVKLYDQDDKATLHEFMY
ncbi:carboxypeptidase-like regulatory domain-containing protein [Tamlana flava]|uniref:carboxypeptidase-like regulatory domain-containing protein n=1 Tax=Tamlana flava TaxID=3158572 RepID=UPI00351BA26E